MNTIIKSTIVLLLLSMILLTTATASVKKGQRLYKKHFYKKCGFSGVVFARHHLQEEWEELYETGKLSEEAKNICPKLNIEQIEEKWWKDIHEYSVKYAKDGVPPNGCND